MIHVAIQYIEMFELVLLFFETPFETENNQMTNQAVKKQYITVTI